MSAGQLYVCPGCGFTITVTPETEDIEVKIKCPRCRNFYLAQPGLTPREKEVVTMLTGGLGYKRIAEKLFISPKTVEDLRTKIYRKLGFKNLALLTKWALKQGLTTLDITLWDEA